MLLQEARDLQGLWEELSIRTSIRKEPYVVETLAWEDFNDLYTCVEKRVGNNFIIVKQKHTNDYLLAEQLSSGKVQIVANLIVG